MHKQFVIGTLIVLAIITGGFAYTQFPYPQPAVETSETARTIEVTFAIEGVLPAEHVTTAEGMTVLELLRGKSREKGFIMSEKEYTGLGILVERLGDLQNGTVGKYWTYTVNSVFAPVGADAYRLKEGDAIEWKFAVPDGSY